MIVTRFDVWLINLDPTIGKEIKKTRPCVVISPEGMNKVLSTVLIAPLTHSLKDYPSRVYSLFNGEHGQVILDQIRSVDKTRLKKLLGKLDKETSSDVLKVLQAMFS